MKTAKSMVRFEYRGLTILAGLSALVAFGAASAAAGPIDGPGPHPVVIDSPFSDLSLTLSVPDYPGVTGTSAISIGGSVALDVNKKTNDGGTTYPGVESLQFTGGNLLVGDATIRIDLPAGLGGANVNFFDVAGSFNSPVLSVDDADYDGTGTFDPAGSVILLDQGSFTIVPDIGTLLLPIVYDLSTAPLALTFNPPGAVTGTIVDPPDFVSIDIPEFIGSIDFAVPTTTQGVSLPVTVELSGNLSGSGPIVPEPSTLALAMVGAAAVVGAALRRRRA